MQEEMLVAAKINPIYAEENPLPNRYVAAKPPVPAVMAKNNSW